MVKFISYTGKFPNLCSGILTLEVNDRIYVFGQTYNNPNNLNSFWLSGGSCGFAGPGYSNEYVDRDAWKIDVDSLPEELKLYAKEIAEVFNANVHYGCCGGCL